MTRSRWRYFEAKPEDDRRNYAERRARGAAPAAASRPSNFVENRIRSIKLTAENALFAGHDEGARVWHRVASLIETSKMNGIEPYA